MKREANFQRMFNHWLKEKYGQIFVFKLPDCGYQNPFDVFSVDAKGKFSAWELKQTQTDSIPFSAVMDHQIKALEIVDGYIAIKYPSFFCVINVHVFVEEKKKSDRKSLTSSRAKEIAHLVVSD